VTRDPWLHRESRDEPAARLFCLPPAGAGAQFFRGWSRIVPAHVEIVALRLPGRESRLGEPALTDMADLLPRLEAALAPHTDLPFVYYGHSMGSALAVELAQRRHQRGEGPPRGLIVSGRRPPHLPPRREPLHLLDDDRLWDKLKELGGLHERVWREPEMKALLLPAVRADLVLVETHRYDASAAPLACPIHVIAAAQDPMVTADEFAAWSERTSAPCTVIATPGGHFFTDDPAGPFRRALGEAAAALL
jgi:medium-chain acyl-[acyl-carrier-protein] hydrolase